ncbi:hypothetical protein CERZMDRAFT_105385 [Cercospora zeae-maydis SCOH1-5]|uniref:Major facilitator superfamily (MFS) profile domain-containing protein n=1 Tax=Cercospora zeae-maydis SCOH1-5 TaxID=717836 RepID=A0A6A6FNL2_9PEZI|nr:hypothetical protein CERZMDRAFT_105385 [Cercospora zeae-maydis SCOH1-5]
MADKDAEAGTPRQIPHFKQVLSKAGITPEVRDWQYEGAGTEEDPYVVVWIDNDPRDPMGYSDGKKWGLTAVVALVTLAVAFISSAYSGGIAPIIREFGCSQIVATLGVSLYVLGFAVGPLLWAPLSEMYGRQIWFTITYACLAAFTGAAAASQNIWTLLILRFFAGSIGSSPLTNAGGVIADIFPAKQRGLAMALFATAPFMGPVLGPIVGGFTSEYAGWRWNQGVMAIFSGLLWVLGTFLVPETYPPVLLRARATELSKMTGKVYKTQGDIRAGETSFMEVFKTSISRPWILLFTEPIVLLLSIYMAIIYGTLYMCFGAFPIVFQRGRGWSPGIGGLAFIGVAVGMIFAVSYSVLENKRYAKISDKHRGFAPPETRLPMVTVGAIAAPVGLFWFAWTNSPSIHWIVPIIGTAPFGFGMVLIFLGLMNYLIDAYTIFAASVLAGNSVLRSLFGAAFPLFTSQMFGNLGIHWASSVPAFLALACVPFPFLFYKYGAAIRKKCKYSAESDRFMKQMAGQAISDDEEEEAADDDSTNEKDSADRKSDSEKTSHNMAPDTTAAASAEQGSSRIEQRAPKEEVEEPRRVSMVSSASDTEEDSPRFAPITQTKSKTSMKSTRSQRAGHAGYDSSPFDLDRINTRESFKAAHDAKAAQRTPSIGSKKSRK